MLVFPDKNTLDEMFSRKDDPLLVIKDEYFIDANQAALDRIGISSVNVFQAFHPAMISPEFQPGGESSKNKTHHNFAALKEYAAIQFDWQHITMKGELFDVVVTLRLRDESDRTFMDVHWKLLP